MLLRLAQKLLLAALLLAVTAPAHAADAPLTKDDVNKIVHDYIMEHPEDILKSVQEYQDRMTKERQTTAMKENSKDLFDEDTPMVGNPKGDVTVVEFFDYNCGYCKKSFPDIKKLIDGDKNIRFLFKDFPILGANSEKAAKWAFAAHKQNKYFEFHQAMMNNHLPINDELLEKIAKSAGMDIAAAKAYTEGADALVLIERNRTLGSNMGIRGTPAFIIGDQVIPGAADYDTLKKTVEEVRAKKGATPAADAPKADAKEEKKAD